jgi:hypothetical protein
MRAILITVTGIHLITSIIFFQPSTPPETILADLTNRRDKKGKKVPVACHPVVIGLGLRGQLTQVFLAVEGELHPITHGLVCAVDRMIKTYFILNMQYAEESAHLLHFLQRSVYGVEDSLTLSRAASSLAVYIRNRLKRN